MVQSLPEKCSCATFPDDKPPFWSALVRTDMPSSAALLGAHLGHIFGSWGHISAAGNSRSQKPGLLNGQSAPICPSSQGKSLNGGQELLCL